jgi:hypothetical protein
MKKTKSTLENGNPIFNKNVTHSWFKGIINMKNYFYIVLALLLVVSIMIQIMRKNGIDVKLTHLKSSHSTNKVSLLIIPGGPGLSSRTLKVFDELSDEFDIYYVDTQGTNGTAFNKDASVNKVIEAIDIKISQIDSKIILIGHSYGGLIASELINNKNVIGLLCISTPFTEIAFSKLIDNYQNSQTKELKAAEDNWLNKYSEISFKKWLASYGDLYFSEKNQENLILDDDTSYRFFLESKKFSFNFEEIKSKISKSNIMKIYAIGDKEMLLDREQSKIDAIDLSFEFYELKGNAHFINKNGSQLIDAILKKELLKLKK